MRAWILLFILMVSSCVKESGNVEPSANSGGTSGTTSGGGTSGGTSTGDPSTGSDPLASEAWHLDNRGQSAFSDSSGTFGEDSSIKEVHDLNILGRGIRIAVSDTGTEVEHPDLSDNALSGEHRNYFSSVASDWYNADPYPSDDNAHGTAVAGLIAALGWNNIGSRGVAPSAKFSSFRFLMEYPEGEPDSSYLARLVDQVYGDFDVFNMSYGMDGRIFFQEDEKLEEALELGVKTLRDNKGALYVQSAGNSYKESYTLSVCNPACVNKTMQVSGNANAHTELSTPYKIVVGAVNALGKRSSYSTPGSNLWVSAPGGEDGMFQPAMITTDLQSCSSGMSYRNQYLDPIFNFGSHILNPRCDYTNIMNGTSSSAPVVSGVIALMLEANPYLSWRDVKHILAETADKVDVLGSNILPHPYGVTLGDHVYDYKWVTNNAGKRFSNWYGFGRVNAIKAVQTALAYNYPLGVFEQTKKEDGTWYYDSGDLTDQVIYDENPAPLENSLWVGHNLVIENVQIQITTDHPFPGNLSVVLKSPKNTESRILTLNNNMYAEELEDFTLSSNAFYGEESAGHWTIKITDGDSLFGSGKLLRWRILINGHRKSTELLNPYPPTNILLGSTPLTSDRTPVFSFTDSISQSSLLRYEARVERVSDGAVIKDWTSIGLQNYGHQLQGLTLLSELHYLKVRAVGAGTRYSSVQLTQWIPN